MGLLETYIFYAGICVGALLGLSIAQIIEKISKMIREHKRKKFLENLGEEHYKICQSFYDKIF